MFLTSFNQKVNSGLRPKSNALIHNRRRSGNFKYRVIQLETLDRRELLAGDTLTSLVPASGGSNVAAIVQNGVQSALNTKVVAYDVTTTGAMSFNLSTGGYSMSLTLPGGMRLDTAALKSLLTGKLALPSFDVAKAVESLGGLKISTSSNYDRIQEKLFREHGGGIVYMSSIRFTEWASPENVAQSIGKAIVSGGSSTSQSLQEARDVLLSELGNLYTWISNKGVKNVDAIMADLLKSIASGADFKHANFSVKFLNVNQSYTVGLGGTANQVAEGLGVQTPKRTVTASHKGFAVIWKGKESSQSSLSKSLERFDGATLKGKPDFAAMLTRLSNRPELQKLGKLTDAVLKSNPAAVADQFVSTRLASALGISKTQLTKLYKSGNPLIDLRATNLGRQLSGLLGKLAQGNEGTTRISKLQFNLNTYEISAEVSLRHRHSWGSLSDILSAIGKQVGQWADKAGNYVVQKLDSAGNLVRQSVLKGADQTTELFNKAGELFSRTVVNNAGVKTLVTNWNKGIKTMETVRDSAGTLVRSFWRDGNREINQWFTNGKVAAETVVQNGVRVAEKTWKDGVNTLNRVRDETGRLVSEYWREGSKEFQNLYTKGVRTAYSTWENGKNTVHYVWNMAGDRVTAFWRDGSREISQWFTNGKVAAETVVQNGVRVAEKTWKDGVNTLNRVRNETGRLVSEYWRDGSKEFQNLYTKGVRTAHTVWENGKTQLHYVWYTAGDRVSAFWRDGSREISQLFTNGKVAAETVVQNGVRVAEKTWKDGVNTLNRVRDETGRLVSEYWRDGSKEFQNLYTKGVRTAHTAWENGKTQLHYVWNKAGEQVSVYWRDGSREFENFYKNGKRVAQNVWENGKNVAQYVWNTGGTYLGNALSKAGKEANDFLGRIGIKL